MTKRLMLLIATAAVISLPACSRVGDMFEGDEPAPLAGERISVLDLQKSLQADAPQGDKPEAITLPEAWVNKAWPQAGGYPNHVMQNLMMDGDGLQPLWRVSIGEGGSKRLPLNARAIAVGDAIFTLDTRSNLSAFDTQGQRVWRVNVRKSGEREDVIAGGLSFGADMLFVTNGYDELMAVNAQDGSEKWRKRLPSPSRAAPTFLDGRVFVTTLDNRLMAFAAANGDSLWEYTGVGETAGLLGTPSPAANNSVVVPAFSSGEVTALRAENGSVAWSDNLANVRQFGGGLESLSDIKAMPILYRGLVIAISFSGKLVAIDEATGMRVWQRDISGSETPWIAGDTLFVVSAENQLAAIHAADGRVLWVVDLPRFRDESDRKGPLSWMGPIMASSRLILISSAGTLMHVDPRTGAIGERVETKLVPVAAPILSNGVLYILSENGKLAAYR